MQQNIAANTGTSYLEGMKAKGPSCMYDTSLGMSVSLRLNGLNLFLENLDPVGGQRSYGNQETSH